MGSFTVLDGKLASILLLLTKVDVGQQQKRGFVKIDERTMMVHPLHWPYDFLRTSENTHFWQTAEQMNANISVGCAAATDSLYGHHVSTSHLS
jgi:hypothetical protein